MRSTAPFAVSAAPSRARGRWLRAPVCRARRFGYSNDAVGRRTAISRSGEAFGDLSGAVDAYGYNLRSEVVSTRRTKDGASVRGFDEDFSYDPIGNRIATTNYDETGSAIVSEYAANSLNQYTSRTVPGVAAVRGFALTNATVTVNENPAYRLGEYFFGSDEFDNSQSSVDAALVTAAAIASPTNGPDEVASVTSRVHIAKTPQLFEYDLDGNQTLVTTKTGTWRVTYNGENRPVLWERVATDSNTLTSNTQTRVSMSFDHQGRRRSYIEVSVDGSTNHIDHFTYDNYLCVARNRWQPDGTSAADRFVWDPTEPVATRPLAWNRSNTTSYYAYDGNKNVTEVITDEGNISAHYEYSPFGALTSAVGDSILLNPWRFSSEYVDDKLGLIYYNYRHYEPLMGRWLSRDPIGEVLDINLLSYCRNAMPQGNDSLGMYLTSSCKESELDTTIGAEFNVGIGKISIFYNNHLRFRICNVCCDDGTKGQTVTREYTNGGGGGGAWQFMLGPVPVEAGFSYLMSGGEVEFYDSCTGRRTYNGCKTVTFTLSAGPSVMVAGVGFAVLGNLSITSTSCLGEDEEPVVISGKLVFRICYLPGICQTKDLWP